VSREDPCVEVELDCDVLVPEGSVPGAPASEGRVSRGRVSTGNAPVDPGASRITVLAPRTTEGLAPARPSLVLPEAPRLVPGDTTCAASLPAVRFSREGSAFRARLEFPAGTSFYGTGEVPGPLERSGRTVTLWNTDSFEYVETNAQLYQSHPSVLVVDPEGRALVVLADSPRRGTIRIHAESCPRVELAFEAEPFDLWLLEAPGPAEATRALAGLIGKIELPPLWALGYHQCRWSYSTEEEVRVLAAEFRRRGIPCDGLWLDIDYMDRFRVFTVDSGRFPDLARLTGELRGRGFHTVAILDPGVAIDSELAAEGLERAVFVKGADGTPATGRVWPGACHFPDFTDAAARAWWSAHVRAFVERTGLDGLWNDMNEPSVMDGPEKTLPLDCIHHGTDGSGGSHARWHNLYGQLMVAASRDGFEHARPERRPFLLTRASHIAGSRLAATWTGDNQATWDHLRWSLTMVLNLGLSGQPFAGPDVGGFSGNPDAELFTRWFELGALLPFFRGHAEKSTRRKEPWSFGEETEALVRSSIERRMRLLPTLYSLFHEAARDGTPVVRPLFFADPADPLLRSIEDCFLLGEELLVAPVVTQGARTRAVLFPRHPGGWYPFPAGGAPIHRRRRTVRAPLGTLPVFARAGSIVFEHEPRASTTTPAEILIVHVFCDAQGQARGRLYEDEGEGHAWRSGVFREAHFTARAGPDEVVIEERATGSFDASTRSRLLVVHTGARTLTVERARAERYVVPFVG